jgi:hypothetical protein
VVETAHEVLMAAGYIRHTAPAFAQQHIDLRQRLDEADARITDIGPDEMAGVFDSISSI